MGRIVVTEYLSLDGVMQALGGGESFKHAGWTFEINRGEEGDKHDLVDELRPMVFPVILGTGKRLFGDTSDKKRLRLSESKTVGDGIAILIFKPAIHE